MPNTTDILTALVGGLSQQLNFLNARLSAVEKEQSQVSQEIYGARNTAWDSPYADFNLEKFIGGGNNKSLTLSKIDAEVTASTGYLNFHSSGVHKVVLDSSGTAFPAPATVSISSGEQYVYVSYARDHSEDPKMAVSATYPISTTTTFKLCLGLYVDKALTVVYHDGDINVDVPLM